MKRIFATIAAACLIIAAASLAQMIKPGSAPGGGGTDTNGLVLLETKTASASASLDFTSCLSDTAYNNFYVLVENLLFSADGISVYIRVSINGGSAFDAAGSDYNWSAHRWVAAGVGSGGADADQINMAGGDVVDNNSGHEWPFNGDFTVFNPRSAALYKVLIGRSHYLNDSTIPVATSFQGTYKVKASAVNAFQIIPSTGTITSGVAYCFGIDK